MKAFLLWDVDGTLLNSNEIGYVLYQRSAREVVGEQVAPSKTPIHGHTDLINANNILRDHGLSESEAATGAQRMLELLPSVLQQCVDDGEFQPDLLPGAREILQATHGAGATNTLLTGNLPETARIKMDVAGFTEFLQLDIGAYGADAPTRPELLSVARERAAASGLTFEDDEIWVIGDTPHDFAVAERWGVRSLLVSTGTFQYDELVKCAADAVLPDLTDTELVLKTLSR